jgi:hypothetical protein
MYDVDYGVQALRDRHERIVKLHKKLKDDLENVKLLYAENVVSLLNHKRSLYDGMNSCIINACNEVADYISKVAEKEIRKNAKSPLKDSYRSLCIFLETVYGIKVKEITSIVTVAYNSQKEITFIDAKYGKSLRLDIPVVSSGYFHPSVGQVMSMDDEKINDILMRLSTMLHFIEEDTEHFTELKLICSYPDMTYNLEDFGKFLDRNFEEDK